MLDVSSPLLSVKDLQAWYGESHILHGVSFDVHQGEVVTLLGRNGAGKTTTMKSIMGIVGQRRGSVKFEGRELIGCASNEIAPACSDSVSRPSLPKAVAPMPAMTWRPGGPGAKPAAAFDGSGAFTVVVGMTSLVGCAGEEFAAILRALGYRMERRPKPPPRWHRFT